MPQNNNSSSSSVSIEENTPCLFHSSVMMNEWRREGREGGEIEGGSTRNIRWYMYTIMIIIIIVPITSKKRLRQGSLVLLWLSVWVVWPYQLVSEATLRFFIDNYVPISICKREEKRRPSPSLALDRSCWKVHWEKVLFMHMHFDCVYRCWCSSMKFIHHGIFNLLLFNDEFDIIDPWKGITLSFAAIGLSNIRCSFTVRDWAADRHRRVEEEEEDEEKNASSLA